MSFSPARSRQFDPDTMPADRSRPTGPRDEDRPRDEDHWGHGSGPSPRDSAAFLLSQSVARISDSELQRMDRSDLIQVARCASSVLPQHGFLRHLPYMTREQLQQLACLARRSCRLQQRPGVPLE